MSKRQTLPWHVYVLAVAAIAIAVLAVAQIGPPTSSARTSTQIVTAANGVVQSTVSGTGNVEAGDDLNVSFRPAAPSRRSPSRPASTSPRGSSSPPSTRPRRSCHSTTGSLASPSRAST